MTHATRLVEELRSLDPILLDAFAGSVEKTEVSADAGIALLARPLIFLRVSKGQ